MTGAPQHHDIHQRDDGLWAIGLGDDSLGPFESREFAQSVALAFPLRTLAPAIPFRKIKLKEARSAGTSP